MTDWYLARSLDIVLAEVNDLWPDRRTASDGTLGDIRHQNEVSQHNPNYRGAVTAADITHDPGRGPDGDLLAAALVAIGKAGHPAPWYVVWNRHIWSRTVDWKRRDYSGDPHTSHVHISVMQKQSQYDSPRPWNLEDYMPLSASDIDKIADAVTKKVWGARFDNRGTDETGDTTTPKLIMERDHKRITDMEAVIVKP